MIDLTQRTESIDAEEIKWIERIDVNKVLDSIIADHRRNGPAHDGIVDAAKEIIHLTRRQEIDGQRRMGGDVDQVGIVLVDAPVLVETKNKRHQPDPYRFCKKAGEHI